MLKTKTSALVSLALVFVSGALVGVLAHRAYIFRAASVNPDFNRKLTTADWRKRILGEMQRKLKLDAGQTKQLNDIFDQMDVQVRDLRVKQDNQKQALQNDLVAKINGILRPDQVELYKQYREEREKERERRKMQGPPGGRGGPGGPGGPPPDSK
jgi:Spy/CpxP family protein refolding chaperone